MSKHILPALLLISALCPAAAQSKSPHEGKGASQAWQAAASQALAQRHDAGALATAALVAPAGGSEYAAQASALSPGNAPVAWVRLRVCASTPACDVRDAATAMRWIDPENAAAWLTTLAAAARDRDGTEVDRILLDMAQGKRFDFYVVPASVMVFDSLSTVTRELPGGALGSDSARLAAATSIADGALVAPFTALNDACRDFGSGARTARVLPADRANFAAVGPPPRSSRARRFRTAHSPPDGTEARALMERRRG